MTINKKNFRSTLAALAFGALVTVLPVSADTISLSISSGPTSVGVGGYDWTFAGATITNQSLTGGLTLDGGTMTSEIGGFSTKANAGATALQSEVIDVSVTPTINGGAPASPVVFQGTIQEVSGVYSLYFGGNGSTGCTNIAVSCSTTANGNVVNNGQTLAAGGYTLLNANGISYEVQTTTVLSSKGAFLNGFVGAAVTPEPATYATTGLAAAFLGLFLRRKKKNS